MTDEEIEALRNFKSEYESCDHYSSDLIIELDDAEILLNLIEKQSKEIEELKMQLEVEKIDNKYNQEEAQEEMIPIYKIKTFIKEELPEDEICECCDIIDVNGVEIKQKLQSLLEKE